MSHASIVLLPGRLLTEPELRSAALDGEVTTLGEGYLPLDTPLTPFARAHSLAPLLVEPRILLSHRTAAWVWGWLPAQPAIATSVPVGARISSGRRRRLGTREVVINESDVRRWGSVGVTTPERTLLDLARHDDGDDVIELLARALRDQPALHDGVLAHLGRTRRTSHSRRARSRLDAAAALANGDQPLLTR